MSFEPKTFDQIYAELVKSTAARLPETVDLEVGSVVRTLYESFAYEMALLYEQMDQVYRSAFIDTASGLQLEMVAAILGIRRGLPDFAEGVVTFERDPGKEDLEIPIGTLVTTEDGDQPRKAYKTIEAKRLPADATTVNVKVQALERGDDQTVAAESIVVMPLPVAGVKAVYNPKPTQFVGKRLETDDELRQRAKSMLLASGKASLTSIETALLSLPGVREVKVVEPFDTQDYGVLDVYVDDSALDGLPASDWLPERTAHRATPALTVDTDEPESAQPDSTQQRQRQRERVAFLRRQLDQVRAAGVYIRLGGAEPVDLDGLLQVEVEPGADREAVIVAMEGAIATHLARLGLGQPLLFPHFTQAILSVAGVTNVEEFALIPRREGEPLAGAPFLSRARRIETNRVASKFRLGQLAIVTGIQPLPVTVEFRTTDLTPDTYKEAIAALQSWFEDLAVGQAITREAVLSQLPEATPAEPESVILTAQNPSLITVQGEGEIRPGFAEKLVLATPLLAYSAELGLVGALKVILPEAATTAVRQSIYASVEAQLHAYLHQLAPEHAISLPAIVQAMAAQDIALAPPVPTDFSIQLDGAELDRLDPDTQTLRVAPFERVRLAHVLISDRLEALAVAITTLEIILRWVDDDIPRVRVVRVNDSIARENLNNPAASEPPVVPPNPPAEPDTAAARQALIADIKTALKNAISTFPAQPPGQDFALAGLRQHLETTPGRLNQFPGLILQVTRLTAVATSADGREQRLTLADVRPLQVRSLEQIQQFTPPKTVTIGS